MGKARDVSPTSCHSQRQTVTVPDFPITSGFDIPPVATNRRYLHVGRALAFRIAAVNKLN
ncbi:MAG TPA: hypothetical protein VIY66_10715 [Candidatus Acidoferrales bacterium]